MPAGTVQDDDGMGTGCHRQSELVEHGLHGGRAHLGENQGDAKIALRADRTEEIDGLMAQVAAAARADAFLVPAAAGAAGLADPGLTKNHTSMRSASGWAAAVSAVSAGNFF